jgi:hypothetical protein
VAALAPGIMGFGPAPATRKVLSLTGLTLARMDVIELNEVFAAQGLAVMRDLGLPDDAMHVNPNGARSPSAIRSVHPVCIRCASGHDGSESARAHRRSLRLVHDVYRTRQRPWPAVIQRLLRDFLRTDKLVCMFTGIRIRRYSR